jgi:long-subunit acyl-CoA synthetase (AMP-forming)
MLEMMLEYDRRIRSVLSKETRRRMWFGPEIRYLVSGGAALSENVLRETRDHLGLRVYQGYGCSEMSPMISMQVQDDDNDANVGTLLPGIEIMFGQDEEVLVRGPNRFMGYLGENLLDHNLFYHTGDAGFMDQNNRLHITGRLTSIVKLSNGRFINLPRLEQDIQQRVHTPLCLWDHEGHIHGAVIRPTPQQWHHLITHYKWIRWHRRQHDFSMADGTLTLKGEVSRRMVQRQCN